MITADPIPKTINNPIASRHLFRFQKASFFILLAYALKLFYIFFYLVGDAVHFGCFLYDQLNFLFVLEHSLNVLGHNFLETGQFPDEDIFLILALAAVEECLKVDECVQFAF